MRTNNDPELSEREIEQMRTRLHARWVRLAEGAIRDWTRRRDQRQAEAAYHCVSELCRLWCLAPPAAIDHAMILVALRTVEEAHRRWAPPPELPITHLDWPPMRITMSVQPDGRVLSRTPVASRMTAESTL